MLDLTVELSTYISAEVCVTVLKTEPDCLCAICPKTVLELILPLVTSLCYWLVLFIDENCLDSG
jgi:hypothetical protein